MSYRVWLAGNLDHFTVQGQLGARTIDVNATHPRVRPLSS